ncbi:origin recognition complex [Phlyctochytrium arcticum]|nr:origin recognition complex [Phlyctochytrium arcticum]
MLGTENPLSDAKQRFPGRAKEIEALYSVLCTTDGPAPPIIHITGPPATGKSSIVSFLTSLLPPLTVGWVNCTDRYTPRLVLESALAQLGGLSPKPLTGDPAGAWGGLPRCDNASEFQFQLNQCLDAMESTESESAAPHAPITQRFLVFDNAERLRDMSPTLLSAILALPQCIRQTISIVLISHLPWSNFRSNVGSLDVETFTFPPYTSTDFLQILTLDCPVSEDREFFGTFVETIYNVFQNVCRDLNELRHLVAVLFPKYMEPVQSGKLARDQTSKLFTKFQLHIKDALHNIYLRNVSSSDLRAANGASVFQPRSSRFALDVWMRHEELNRDDHSFLLAKHDVELPYYTKFLVIAAFLASYNPAKLDVRFFAKGIADVAQRKKGGKGKGARVSKEGGKMRQQLVGPKSFPVERLLAIFYSILENDVDSTVDIQIQIASLCNLRLLSRVTAPDRLDSIKLKSNTGFEFIKSVARSVRFDIVKYLYDFV